MKFLDTKIGQGIIWFFIGIFFIIVNDVISTKTVGYIVIVFSLLYLIGILYTDYQLKRSKKSREIKNSFHSMIAYYLERRKIKYIYLPKDEKELTFALPEYEIYIKYWEKEQYNKEERKKILKKLKNRNMHFIELFHDNLNSIKQLDWKFNERLLETLKKK